MALDACIRKDLYERILQTTDTFLNDTFYADRIGIPIKVRVVRPNPVIVGDDHPLFNQQVHEFVYEKRVAIGTLEKFVAEKTIENVPFRIQHPVH